MADIRFTKNLTLDRLIRSLEDAKTRNGFTGYERVTDAKMILDEHNEEYPYGTLLLRMEEQRSIEESDVVRGTLWISPERLNEHLN